MADRISIRELTTQLEKLDGHNAPAFFKDKFESERFQDLAAIQALNKADLNEHKTDVTLDCDKDFYYSANTSIRASKGSLDSFFGGKQLYSDTLDLHTLTHSDPDDKVPTAIYPPDIRKLTTSLENGDGTALKETLGDQEQEERIAVLLKVQAMNQQDLADKTTSNSLEISVAGPKHNASFMSVELQPQGFGAKFFGGGKLIYSDNLQPETGSRDITALKPKL
jgi:hypothetical protein